MDVVNFEVNSGYKVMADKHQTTDIVTKTMNWFKSWGFRKPLPTNGRPQRRRKG